MRLWDNMLPLAGFACLIYWTAMFVMGVDQANQNRRDVELGRIVNQALDDGFNVSIPTENSKATYVIFQGYNK